MTRTIAGLALACLLASIAVAAPAPKVTVAEYADMVVVYVNDLDELRAAYPALAAEVRLAGVKTVYRVDLTADYQQPAVLIRKTNAATCGKVTVALSDGGRELLRREFPTQVAPPAQPRLAMTADKAFIEKGADFTGEAPVILQPDLTKAPPLELGDAARTVEMNSILLKAESDTNFPLISANNNCAISRQTAHPDDPNLRSCYVPLKSQLYDPKTGQPTRVVHYLAEVPLKTEWLKGTEDTVIQIGAGDIKIHTTDKRWPPDNPRGEFITGQGAGGLGQLVGSVAVDDDGNIYYSASMAAHVIRFNIAKAAWEAPPINIIAAMNELLPKKGELPENLRDKGARWDEYGYVAVGGGHMFFSPVRYADYGTLYCNGVFSFPIKDWYDAENFRAGTRMVARSWPESQLSLYDKWPIRGGTAPKVAPGVYHDGKYYLTAYANSGGGPWCIGLDADGGGTRVTPASQGDVNKAWSAATPKMRVLASSFINWWDYGALATSRAQLSHLLTGTRDANAKGAVTLYYDAIAAMRLAPDRYAEVLNNIKGPSLAPCYMAVGIPDKRGHVLGVGEYGYYLADLDLAGAANGVVTKSYLQLDTGEAKGSLPVKIGLGPYGHIWWREGNKRYLIMVGYTGIAQMLYSVDGKPLDRFDSVLMRVPARSLDGSGGGGFKWVQYPVAGIDGRVYMTGTHQVDRGGHPYANGLLAYSPAQPKEALRLAQMTRACSTVKLRARVLYEPDGSKRQEFALAGGMSVKAYILQMAGKNLPENNDAKIFLYAVNEGGEPKDLFGFSLPVMDEKVGNGVEPRSGAAGQVFSRDRRFLVTLQHGCILTFDLAANRYVDARKIEGSLWRFCKPDLYFNVTPDDRILLCVQPQDAAKATFYEVEISPAGAVALKPYLTVTGPDAKTMATLNGAVIAFAADPSGDGSYDLCLGPYWRTPGTTLRVISDFLPPRK